MGLELLIVMWVFIAVFSAIAAVLDQSIWDAIMCLMSFGMVLVGLKADLDWTE